MGNASSAAEVERAVHRAQHRVGRLPVQGRYNRLPRRFEEDYDLEPTGGFCQGQGLDQGRDRRASSPSPGVASESSQDTRQGFGLTVSVDSQDSDASGQVTVARSKHTGTLCVVKKFNLKHMKRGAKKELGCEIETLLSMDHPHLVRLIEVYESEMDIVLVMERLEGDDLSDYLLEHGKLAEKEVAQLTRQMLLVTSYMHRNKIVHGNLDFNKFAFDRQGSDFLMLSDLGFSKFFKKDATMAKLFDAFGYGAAGKRASCDSEVSCDLWSLGVMASTLLHGSDDADSIAARLLLLDGDSTISPNASDFVRRLLAGSAAAAGGGGSGKAAQGLTAAQALAHPWLKEHLASPTERCCTASPCGGLKQGVNSLVSFAQASRFKKECARLMAWTLSLDECVCVRGAFLALDKSQIGVIKLMDLKELLVDQCGMPKSEFMEILHTFDSWDARSTEGVINYSDFRAAMLSGHIGEHDASLKDAFRRFDADGSGYITAGELRRLLGAKTTSDEVRSIVEEVDLDKDGRISEEDFVAYLRGISAKAARSGA